jgi:cell division protein FtsZ
MSETGMALMGTGISSGESRSVEAAQKAISSPLLEDISIEGARGLLINITGGQNMTLNEINEATTLIQKEAHEEANIIWGMVIDEKMRDEVRVTVIATGFGKSEEKVMPKATATKKVAPISFSIRESLRDNLKENPKESLKEIFKESAKESYRENNREVPTFMRKAKVKERFDELKLVETPDFSMEDEDRFDIPTFLRKQAD